MQTQDANLNHSRNIAILVAIILVSGLATAIIMYSSDRFSLLYYGDAVSHLVAARKLFDWSENPGWAQLGTVWLPVPHFLLMFPSMVDSLFFSGFAGVAISLPSLTLTSVFIYKIIVRILSQQLASDHWIIPYSAFAGALLYGLNPNFLYLGITAMTEAPFMLFFVGSAYYLLKWFEIYRADEIQRQTIIYVLIASLFACAATLCRYEGWILPPFVVVAAIMTAIGLQKKKTPLGANSSSSQPDHTQSNTHAVPGSSEQYKPEKSPLILTILASLVSTSGIVFWLVYNKITYGNALEFESAQYYSAASQALSRPIRETLFLQPLNDFNVYGVTMFMVFGPVVLAAAGVGYFLYLRSGRMKSMAGGEESSRQSKRKLSSKLSSLFLLYLALPPAFTISSLLIGIGEMTLWFNSRFVILAAPVVIIFVALYIARQPKTILQNRILLVGVIASLFVFQSVVVLASSAVVTLADAKGGYGYGQAPFTASVGDEIKHLYDGKGSIMMVTGSAQEHRIMISSGIPLHNYDDIIVSSTWKKSYYEPWNSGDTFIILSNEPDSDAVDVIKYWNDHMQILNEHYHQVFANKYYEILSEN